MNMKKLSDYIEVPNIKEFEKPVFHRFIILEQFVF